MSRKIILIKQELLLLVYELNRSGLLAENEKIDRKSGSAGMPRPISYAVFCLKKKKINPSEHWQEQNRLAAGRNIVVMHFVSRYRNSTRLNSSHQINTYSALC